MYEQPTVDLGRHKAVPVRSVNKLAIVIVCGLLSTLRVRAQEHAPTLAVCQGDQALWHNTEQETDYFKQETKHISDGVKNTNPIAKLTIRELSLRADEMGDCMSVDKANLDDYFKMNQFYHSVLSDRYFSFIDRHHLRGQLMAEDKAGVR